MSCEQKLKFIISNEKDKPVLSFFQVRAGESLMKLVSDIRQFLILNDFPSVNESIRQKVEVNKQVQSEVDKTLLTLRDDMAAHLYELEEEYYSSAYK